MLCSLAQVVVGFRLRWPRAPLVDQRRRSRSGPSAWLATLGIARMPQVRAPVVEPRMAAPDTALVRAAELRVDGDPASAGAGAAAVGGIGSGMAA